MIGIMETELNTFVIIEYIKKKYPKINLSVYYLKEDIEEGIKKLQSTCKIIIIPNNSNINEITGKYPNIGFIPIRTLEIENAFSLDQKQIIEAIQEGNENKLRSILKQIKLEKEKVIIFNQLELLWIKPIIQEMFPNPIKSNIDLLLEDLEREIIKRKIPVKQEGNTIVRID